MAATVQAAFAAVAGPRLDRLAGLEVPERSHQPVEPAVAAMSRTLAGVMPGVKRALIKRLGCSSEDAEEAIQNALCSLFETQLDLFREDATNWWGLLYTVASRQYWSARRGPVRIDPVADVDGRLEREADEQDLPVSSSSGGLADYEDVAPPLPGQEWTDAQIIGSVQRFHHDHGRAPRARECRRLHQMPSLATICKRFGGFAAALQAAGLEVPRPRHRDWILADGARACCAFRFRNWRWPDAADFRQNPGLPSEERAREFFGGTHAGAVQEGSEDILAWLRKSG